MGNHNPVVDLANWAPPQRIIKNGKGRPIIEKVSPLLSRKVVDLDGNVCQQPASNGIANRSPQDPYGLQTHNEKLYGRPRMIKGTPGGILPYSKCPIAIGAGHFLEEHDIPIGAPCTVAHNGNPISNSDACKCIVALIDKRQALALERNQEAENRINKLAKLQEQAAQSNADAAQRMAEAAQALAAVAAAAGQGGKKREP